MSRKLPPAAGNGLMDRRLFLQGAGLFGAGLTLRSASAVSAEARAPWMQSAGAPLSPYGTPSVHESAVVRKTFTLQPGTLGSGASRTPLQHLRGAITPAGLHFERHHSGVPAIDPEQHALVVHGLVDQPLRFTLDQLLRYPMQSRILFLECSGNSAANLAAQPPELDCAGVHGLVSGSEWTGIPLRVLLDEAGVRDGARWVIAEGADAARMNRSVPMHKMMDDALLALYQNGERLRPEQGYPMRLLLPGYEGNTSVKWLHRLQVSDVPAMSRQETSKYTDLLASGRAEVFTFPMSVKSVITSPAPGLALRDKGFYEISGIAWSGAGAVRGVEVSADGGASWAEAELEAPVLPQALTRFRIPWRWDGAPCVLKSRARDAIETQPTRDALLAQRGQHFFYHYNAIQAWQIDADGAIRNSYA